MPKMKNHSGASKRFRRTGTGKIKRRHQNHRHILTKKSKARKRHLRKSTLVHPADMKKIENLLPY